MTETRTYRGATLEEVLPKIREELGPDAVITRQREGVVGGIGGFFGKKCIEVEAQAPERRPVSAVPVRHAFDAYDQGTPTVTQDDLRNPVIDTLIGQASPFAEHLRAAAAEAGAGEAGGGGGVQ